MRGILKEYLENSMKDISRGVPGKLIIEFNESLLEIPHKEFLEFLYERILNIFINVFLNNLLGKVSIKSEIVFLKEFKTKFIETLILKESMKEPLWKPLKDFMKIIRRKISTSCHSIF